MLNGKFYTGLPPDMMERQNSKQNRMQSSIFWPDDTKVDSALETRVKRRTSLQLDQAERPPLRTQASVGDNDVNTRQMFQKEFSKSSIQFQDNLQEPTGNVRKPLLRTINCARSDVTPKPTALKLPLPEDVVNEAYTSAKKKQAFTSKIEFNDYIGDEANNNKTSINNTRQRKMDMNDKREVERNTKNSPKLQVKNSMRDLGMDEHINIETNQKSRNFDRNGAANSNRTYEKSLRRATPRLAPARSMERIYSTSPTRDNRRERRIEVDMEEPEYHTERYNNSSRVNQFGRAASVPKRILKNPVSDYEQNREARYSDYYDGYIEDDIDYAERRIRDMRISTSPKKHVTYRDEMYDYYDEMPNTLRSAPAPRSRELRAPNMTAGSSKRQQGLRYNNNNDVDVIDVDTVEDQHFNQTDNRSTMKSLNNNSNRANFNNNRYKSNKSNVLNHAVGGGQQQYSKMHNNNRPAAARKTPIPTSEEVTTAPPQKLQPETTSDAEAVTDVKKHLRSSLCLHNGEIVANDSDAGSGGATTKTPTRNARNTAMRQRVSVGLPD